MLFSKVQQVIAVVCVLSFCSFVHCLEFSKVGDGTFDLTASALDKVLYVHFFLKFFLGFLSQ